MSKADDLVFIKIAMVGETSPNCIGGFHVDDQLSYSRLFSNALFLILPNFGNNEIIFEPKVGQFLGWEGL